MLPRDMAYMLDILVAAKDIREFSAGMDQDGFMRNKIAQAAVIRCMEVIGEAAKRLSQEARDELPGLPWSQMARMRDFLIHAYDRVDLNKVWDTIINDMPVLIATLEPIIPHEDES